MDGIKEVVKDRGVPVMNDTFVLKLVTMSMTMKSTASRSRFYYRYYYSTSDSNSTMVSVCRIIVCLQATPQDVCDVM